METAMDRAQKQESIEALKGVFAGSGAVVVTHYMGLTVAEMTDLRGRLRKEGAQLQVVKNTLAQKALGGSIGEAGDALFKGPVAIAFASDPVSAAKVATQYAKDNDKFTVIGGFMGQQVLDKSSVTALATLPSLDQLRAKIVGRCKPLRPRSPVFCKRPPVSWLASSAPTPPKTPPDRHFPTNLSLKDHITWPISKSWWTTCPP
jgi:large subunit ribosomal protein L10